MSQNEYLRKIAEGVVGFSGDMKIFTDEIRENLDKVLTRHYQANHTPYAVMSFEDEYHYWEERLAEAINRVEYPDYDTLEPKGVTMLQRRSYVIVRGNLKSGNTIHFDNTKFNQLYINGERYTGDYTFNGETPEMYERLVIVAVQTPFNLGVKDYGKLEMTVADFPIENAEVFANVGTYSNLQPAIEELLETETAESLYIKGDWTWNTSNCVYIKTLKTLDNFLAIEPYSFKAPLLLNYIIPNSLLVPRNHRPYSIKNVDMRNAGNISQKAFADSLIEGELYISNTGSIGENAFNGCLLLTAVYIGDGITSINTGAFRDIPSLLKVIIGDNVTVINGDVFAGTPVIELHLGKNITTFNNSVLGGYFTLDRFTVSKGYHCGTTHMPQRSFNSINVVETFLEVVKNCANIGEDGRTAATMTFKVNSSTRTAITNAYNAGDEKAIELYDLMSAKSISITA